MPFIQLWTGHKKSPVPSAVACVVTLKRSAARKQTENERDQGSQRDTNTEQENELAAAALNPEPRHVQKSTWQMSAGTGSVVKVPALQP